MKILVAYASRHGATRGIAERIAQTLERCGLDVTLSDADAAIRVGEYDAYVIGSAAYMGRWMTEAAGFVRRNRLLLAGRPVWLFSSGPVGTDTVDAQGRDVVEASAPREFAEFAEAIGPREARVFFGAWNPDAEPVGFAERMMSGLGRLVPAVKEALPIGDFRDWPAIEGWAEGIARELSVPASA